MSWFKAFGAVLVVTLGLMVLGIGLAQMLTTVLALVMEKGAAAVVQVGLCLAAPAAIVATVVTKNRSVSGGEEG